MCLAVPMIVAAAAGLDPNPAYGQGHGPVLVVGDSLELGTSPHLRRELSGEEVKVNARAGRQSREGLTVLRRLIRPVHRVVVFDLGTNDDPSRPRRLSANLAGARRLAGKRCLVVVTLVRPPVDGVRADPLNDVVDRFGSATSAARVADWRAAASRSPELIGPDGVHATRDGYAARGRLLAEAVRSCSKPPDPRRPAGRSGRAAPPDREPLNRVASSARGVDLLSALAQPVKLPLAALRRAAGLLEGAVQQAQGAVVPIVPDQPLGRPGDPLGKRSP